MDLDELAEAAYGAKIIGGRIGPRRELTIGLELWPTRSGVRMTTWHPGTGPRISVRFGGISNFDELSAFFAPLLDDREHIDGLHYLRYAKNFAGRPDRFCVGMGFDRSGARIEIHCRTVTVSSSDESMLDEQAIEHPE